MEYLVKFCLYNKCTKLADYVFTDYNTKKKRTIILAHSCTEHQKQVQKIVKERTKK
jgi:hypothetical protein